MMSADAAVQESGHRIDSAGPDHQKTGEIRGAYVEPRVGGAEQEPQFRMSRFGCVKVGV